MPKLKKIAGVATVIMLTFVIPALVTTVTSSTTFDSRSKAADIDTNTNTSDTTNVQPKSDALGQMAANVYPIVVGIIVFVWLVVILIYVGFGHKRKFSS